MKKIAIKLLFGLGIVIFAGATAWAMLIANNVKEIGNETVDDVLKATLEKRLSVANAAESPDPNALDNKTTINILLLGVDSRENVISARCDAIQMLSFNVKNWTVKITSVPRGTYTYIKGYPYSQSYLSNACSILGINATKQRIEKLVGVKADYTVKIGFAQTYGILRQLKMPTTQSVQWLRNRKTFAIGDPQRSHNQAVFIKDLALKHIDKFGIDAMLPVEKLLYSFVSTDLDFASFHALLKGYKEARLSDNANKIQTAMKPYYKVKDYHLNFDNPQQSLKLVGVRSAGSSNPSDRTITLQAEQKKITAFINDRLKRKLSLADIIKKQLWLQIETEKTRETLEFEVVKRHVTAEVKSLDAKIEFLSNYIIEKETQGLDDWAIKGKKLMDKITA